MKRQKLFLVCSVVLLFLMACRENNGKAEISEDKAEEKQAQSSHTKNEDSLDKEEIWREKTDGEAPSEMAPWEQAYLNYLEEFDANGACTYSLIYVDEDEIPELVIDTGAEAGGCQILTWHDDVLDGLQTYRLNFSYIEKKNLLCNSDGHMGYYYDSVYTIKDGLWEFIGGGAYHDPKSGPQYDEDGNEIFEYEWLEQPVEKAEYEEKLQTVYPEKDGEKPGKYYIKDEICSVLKMGETTSVKHRYELIVEDITWTEARRACEEKGGYLATLTSQEEFEQVQAQILSEEKTAVTFFVGAADNQNAWGYAWLEPGREQGYSMLNLYNALFQGYWLEGEPSYKGLTEEGETVDEDCVSLIYRTADERCYLNDVPDDILAAVPSFAGRIGYICEYDE